MLSPLSGTTLDESGFRVYFPTFTAPGGVATWGYMSVVMWRCGVKLGAKGIRTWLDPAGRTAPPSPMR